MSVIFLVVTLETKLNMLFFVFSRLMVPHYVLSACNMVPCRISICIWRTELHCASIVPVKKLKRHKRHSIIAFSAIRQFVPSPRAKVKFKVFCSTWEHHPVIKVEMVEMETRVLVPVSHSHRGDHKLKEVQLDHQVRYEIIFCCFNFYVRTIFPCKNVGHF